MPFGIRRPSEYTKPGRLVVHPDNYESCPICNKPINIDDDGRVPVAPCLIPPNELADHDLIVVLGCSSCYQAQKRLGFTTIEEFRAHRLSKNGRWPSNQNDTPKSPSIKKPRKPKAVEQTSDLALGSLSKSDLKSLQKAYEIIGKILGRSTETENVGRCDTEESDLSRRVMCQGLPDDDIEFGMTEEQKAKMDKAVHDAAERTKLVPSEDWNNRTASEILEDNNGVPNGW